MANRYVYFFGEGGSEGDPARKDLLGGKGASLAAMSRAGLPVPPGFTISAECCPLYLEGDGRWPEGLEEEIRANLARLEEATGRTYGRGPKPLLVSVRSGAAVSMPGMMDTILNCGLHPGLGAEGLPGFWQAYGDFVAMFAKTVAGIPPAEFDQVADARAAESATRREDFAETEHERLTERCRALYAQRAGRPFPTDPWRALVECIEAVFRSWNSERAIAYRKHHDIRGLLGTAVNVQAMFPSEISGIAFTTNPNDPAANEMIIESSYGLGETVVSGDVLPDRFIVDGATLGIRKTILGRKTHIVRALGDSSVRAVDAFSLAPEQVGELAQLARRVEGYFGVPVDIEWGWADGRFSLLQARPIRGLDIVRDVEVGRQDEIGRLRALAGTARRVWIAHNLAETLSSPTPLTWDITAGFMSGDGGFGLMYQDFGYRPSARVRREGFLELICGRIYADPDRAAELFWEGMPLEYDLDALVKDKGLLGAPPSRFNADKAGAAFLLRLPATVWSMLRSARRLRRLRREVLDLFEKSILPPYLDYVREKRSRDLTRLSTAEVIAELGERRRKVLDEFGKESLKPGFFGGMALEALQGKLTQLMGRDEGTHLTLALTAGLPGDTTVEQDLYLLAVARGEATLADFLVRYGHRAVGEMELAETRWREDPSYIEKTLATYRRHPGRSPEETHAANERKREKAQLRLPGLLAQWGGSSLAEEINLDLRDAQRLLPYRERAKHYLMMGYELIRLALLELARRWDLGRDVFFLRLDELERFERDRAALREAIARRKTRWQSAQRLELPDVVDSAHLDDLGKPLPYEAASEFQGDPVAPGIATGTARIVFDPQEARDLGADFVLVCPSTDPGWAPLFASARGLVIERGGILSHGAIVARDFGIPAVVCPDATRRIPDGATLRVNGNHGTISVVKENNA